MTVYNKIKWVLGIALVFILIISTNLIDKNNFNRVKDTVETIYEDRLVAKGLIFQIQSIVHEKEIAARLYDSAFLEKRNKELNKNLISHIEKFETTKLTRDEDKIFLNLKKDLASLKTAEKIFYNSDSNIKSNYLSTIAVVKNDLQALSKIQLSEGERQLFISKKAIQTVELFTKIEIYLLIGLAILIQFIILYNPKRKRKKIED